MDNKEENSKQQNLNVKSLEDLLDENEEEQDSFSIKGDSKKKDQWINLNDDYVLPRSYVENCVVYIQRVGFTLYIKTIDMHDDLKLVLTSEAGAVEALKT